MLNTKDVAGFLRPLAAQAESLTAIPIPGEANTLPADDRRRGSRPGDAGHVTAQADSMRMRFRGSSRTPRARVS